jgi:hypothetical protein
MSTDSSHRRKKLSLLGSMALTLLFGLLSQATAQVADSLPSWNEGASKRAIVEFVGKVTRQDGPDFVTPADRIAVFDNDGTLWAEHPMYFSTGLRT